jgi:hypothetical protein
MKLLFTTVLLTLTSITLSAQEEVKKEEFKVTGKPEILVFSNFNSTITNGKSANEFQVQRAYFGYRLNISENFTGRVTLDVGNPKDGGDYEQTAYLKYAYLQYEKKNLMLNFGMVGNILITDPEKAWGNRYIYRDFADQNKFAHRADYGLTTRYEIGKIGAVEFQLSNGDGYKKTAVLDSSFLYAGAIDFYPIKRLTLRAYGDISTINNVTRNTVEGFIGYKTTIFNIGGQYIYQFNNDFTNDKDLFGFSVYGNYNLSKKWKLFARYDKLSSNTLVGDNNPWNFNKNMQLIFLGTEFCPIKNVNLAPNLQYTIYDDPAKNNSLGIYLNVQFRL